MRMPGPDGGAVYTNCENGIEPRNVPGQSFNKPFYGHIEYSAETQKGENGDGADCPKIGRKSQTEKAKAIISSWPYIRPLHNWRIFWTSARKNFSS